MPIPLGILAAAGFVAPSGRSYDLLSTTILATNTASVTFASLGTYAADYQHLQIRLTGRTTGVNAFPGIQYNSDTGTNYGNHELFGNGSSVTSGSGLSRSNAVIGPLTYNVGGGNEFGAIIVDFLDVFSTTKFKTSRSLGGRVVTGNSEIRLASQLWRNTDSVTSIKIVNNFSDSFVTGSRFSLYGLRKV
jgi:hypothetical protein